MVQFQDAVAVQLSLACHLLQQAIQQLQLCLPQEQTTAKLLEKLSCFPTFQVCNDRQTSCLNDYGKTSKENSMVKLCLPPPPKENQLTENIPALRVKLRDVLSVKTSEVTHATAPTTRYKNTNASEALTKVTSTRAQRARGMESTFATPNLFSALRAQAAKPTALRSRMTQKVKESGDNEQQMKLQFKHQGERNTNKVWAAKEKHRIVEQARRKAPEFNSTKQQVLR